MKKRILAAVWASLLAGCASGPVTPQGGHFYIESAFPTLQSASVKWPNGAEGRERGKLDLLAIARNKKIYFMFTGADQHQVIARDMLVHAGYQLVNTPEEADYALYLSGYASFKKVGYIPVSQYMDGTATTITSAYGQLDSGNLAEVVRLLIPGGATAAQLVAAGVATGAAAESAVRSDAAVRYAAAKSKDRTQDFVYFLLYLEDTQDKKSHSRYSVVAKGMPPDQSITMVWDYVMQKLMPDYAAHRIAIHPVGVNLTQLTE